MASIKEVAAVAGVSPATVSRVLNGNQIVSPAKKERVMKAMEALEYKPNAFAKSLATNRSQMTGMVVGALSGPFYGPMMHSAEQALRQGDQYLLVTSGKDSYEQEKKAIEFLLDRRCDALILHVNEISDPELIELSQGQTPVILVNRYIAELAENCVYLDNELGAYMATRYLLELGHSDIACITGLWSKQDSRERLQGYKRAMAEAGIGVDPDLVVEGHFEESGGVDATEELLKRGHAFTAIVAGNDYIAMGAIEMLRKHDLRVPEHVSVIGFDDVQFARYLTPKLTTVRFPVEEMGKRAAELSLQRIKNITPVGEGIELKPRLIIRGSVAPAAG